MTEDHRTCIRGCKRRCHSDECVAGAECTHDLRRRATVGNLCRACSERLLEAVADIPDLYADLPPLDAFGHDGGEKVRRGKISDSPALARLDVMVLQGYGDWGDGVMPIWNTVYGWLRVIEDDMRVKPKGYDLTTIAGFLRVWHSNICAQPWVDAYWVDMIEMRAALRRATGAPPPIGRCFGRITNRPCGRLLYPPPPGETTIVCPDEDCARRYTGRDLLMLQIQAEREGAA